MPILAREDRDRILANLPDAGSLGEVVDLRIGSQTFRPPSQPEGMDPELLRKSPRELLVEIERVIEAGKLLGLASREGFPDDITEKTRD